MKIRLAFVSVALSIMLVGCATAPQPAIKFSSSKLLAAPEKKVGVIMTKLPKVDTSFPGAYCLLCYAAASAANSTLTKHTHTLSYEDLLQVKKSVADTLHKSGFNAVVIADDIDIKILPSFSSKIPNVSPPHDFRALKAKYGVDRLVVIEVTNLGVERQYSAYVPTSDPKAVLVATGYIVDLNDNSYQWYQTINIQKAADGAWDEPPTFPGLTNAYFQALEQGKDDLLTSLRAN